MTPSSTKSFRNVFSSRNRQNPRAVKRKMSNFPLRKPGTPALPAVNPLNSIKVIK